MVSKDLEKESGRIGELRRIKTIQTTALYDQLEYLENVCGSENTCQTKYLFTRKCLETREYFPNVVLI